MGAAVRSFLFLILIGFFTGFGTAEARVKHHYTHHLAHNHTYSTPIYHSYGTAQLVAQINRAVQNIGPSARVGVTIKSMKYGDSVYTRNDKLLFVPASTMKVFTAEAALLYLGPQFTFPTRFVTDGTISNGVLNGNVFLINSGDPSLTYYDVADLVESLKTQQISQITGNVYIDNTAYDQVNTGPGWLWRDTKYCYGAPINASIINHNCRSYKATPNKATTISDISDPSVYYASFQNPVTPKTHDHSCDIKIDGEQGGTITISDCEYKNGFVYSKGVSNVITNVVEYDKTLLQSLFKRYNIQVEGTISAGSAAPQALELARHESKPLKDLISNMLKMSDNVIAGSLFKKIGELYTHRQGTWENGGNAVSQILTQQAYLNAWKINLIDGSGLSRNNQATPAQMLQVLDFAYHNNATNYDFISALPVAGVDGTLKRRMRNLAWKVRAKTGTMQGVVSLAGYATSADKEPFAFVIMINGRGGVWQYREVEDKILNVLTHYSRT
jgi:D-alanyl-D-alanine carboxypeptidase/D-alanyl-D-alanine-endopeptidase (penicillin-binding protein 4)